MFCRVAVLGICNVLTHGSAYVFVLHSSTVSVDIDTTLSLLDGTVSPDETILVSWFICYVYRPDMSETSPTHPEDGLYWKGFLLLLSSASTSFLL
jgi:hypothetical protein